jgi:hypothetical protein
MREKIMGVAPMMNNFTFAIGNGSTRISVVVVSLGKDINISIQGGQGHIGSMVIGIPRPSLADKTRMSATTSVFNLTGHMDDSLTQPLAQQLAAETGRVVSVVGGFHLDNITPEEIEAVKQNVESARTIIAEKLR